MIARRANVHHSNLGTSAQRGFNFGVVHHRHDRDGFLTPRTVGLKSHG